MNTFCDWLSETIMVSVYDLLMQFLQHSFIVFFIVLFWSGTNHTGCSYRYTRKNAQVVTSLQTSCNKSVHKLSTSCVRTACSYFVVTSLEQVVNNL